MSTWLIRSGLMQLRAYESPGRKCKMLQSDITRKIIRSSRAAALEKLSSPQMVQKTKAVRFPVIRQARIIQTLRRADAEKETSELDYYEIEFFDIAKGWSADHGIYYIGDIVKYSFDGVQLIYKCAKKHSSKANLPPAGGENSENYWNESNIKAWAFSVEEWSASHGTYSVGDIVKYTSDGVQLIYECTEEHSSSSELPPTVETHWKESTHLKAWVFGYSGDLIEAIRWFQPGDITKVFQYNDSRWADRKWWILETVVRVQVPSKVDNWAVDHGTYFVGDIVKYTSVYRCILQHESEAGKSPTNETYWELSSRTVDCSIAWNAVDNRAMGVF